MISCSPELGASSVSTLCVSYALLLWLSLHSVQLSAVDLFAFYGQGLIPVLLVGQSGATLGLSSLRLGIGQSYSHTELQGTLPMLSQRSFHWWVGLPFCSDVCLSPLLRPQTGMCSYLPSPRAGVTWSDIGPFWGCLHTATMLVVLHWVDSCHVGVAWGRSSGDHRMCC